MEKLTLIKVGGKIVEEEETLRNLLNKTMKDFRKVLSVLFLLAVLSVLFMGADVPLRSWLHNWVSRVRWWAVAGLRMLTC